MAEYVPKHRRHKEDLADESSAKALEAFSRELLEASPEEQAELTVSEQEELAASGEVELTVEQPSPSEERKQKRKMPHPKILEMQQRIGGFARKNRKPLTAISALLLVVIVFAAAQAIGEYQSMQNAHALRDEASQYASNLRDATWGALRDDSMSIQVGDHSVAGFIEIPTLEINLPVLNRTAGVSQAIAICRYSEDVSPGGLGGFQLSGTSARWQFGRINSLKPGDVVSYTDILGNHYEYAVADETLLGNQPHLELLVVNGEGIVQHTVNCLPQ